MPVINFSYLSFLFISYFGLGYDICGILLVLFFLCALFIIFKNFIPNFTFILTLNFGVFSAKIVLFYFTHCPVIF